PQGGGGGVARAHEFPGGAAELLGFTGQPLDASCIDANRFVIVGRGLSAEACGRIDRRAAALARPDEPSALLFINYYGEQRFGSARHGAGFAGPALCRGDFETALRLLIGTPARADSGRMRTFTRMLASRWGQWPALARELPACPERAAVERLAAGGSFRDAFDALPNLDKQFAVEAWQSHVWNLMAAHLAEGADADPLRVAVEHGVMVFPPASALAPAGLWGLGVPTLGPGVWLEARLQQPAAEALRASGVASPEDLRIPGLRRPAFGVAERPLVAAALNFSAGPREDDELAGGGPKKVNRFKRTLAFDLPRGSYATVLLRALGEPAAGSSA
ncbi:MAG: tRNA pseudouridine(13) synthase TruD, partial [Phycisphaerales bacterium]|nr:tRNA pseudouridine(13) synthase TruD [Phycisphaerales bacterium]